MGRDHLPIFREYEILGMDHEVPMNMAFLRDKEVALATPRTIS